LLAEISLYKQKMSITNIFFLLSVLTFTTKFFGRLGRHEVIQEKYKILGEGSRNVNGLLF